MPRSSYLGFLLCAATLLVGCDKPTPPPLRVPTDASLHIAASSLAELRAMAAYLVDIPAVATAADEQSPAWLACDADLCVLQRGRAVEQLAKTGASWVAPSGKGSVEIWGVDGREEVESALSEWQQSGDPANLPAEGLTGFVDPDPFLARWKPTSERSTELLQRVLRQTGRFEFAVETDGRRINVTATLENAPGEPQFVRSLGVARADLGNVAGLVDGGVLAVLRLAADPEALWELVYGTLSAPQRTGFDEVVHNLKTEAAIDPVAVLQKAVVGNAVLVVYGLSDRAAEAPADWLALRATNEALWIPLQETKEVRRLLNAWTQLSHGNLRVQSTEGDQLEWAWVNDGELMWTLMLRDDGIMVVDSSVALDHVRAWETEGGRFTDVLSQRGVDELVAGADRTGVYVDLKALRSLGEPFSDLVRQFDAATVVAKADAEGGEQIEIYLTMSEAGSPAEASDSD